MATYPLSYVRLPDDLGGAVVTAEHGSGFMPGSLRPSEYGYLINNGASWTMTLRLDYKLEEIAPEEPADCTMWIGGDGVLYERLDSRGIEEQRKAGPMYGIAHSDGDYRWWASDIGGPMRWPNVWHRCKGSLTRLAAGEQAIVASDLNPS